MTIIHLYLSWFKRHVSSLLKVSVYQELQYASVSVHIAVILGTQWQSGSGIIICEHALSHLKTNYVQYQGVNQ